MEKLDIIVSGETAKQEVTTNIKRFMVYFIPPIVCFSVLTYLASGGNVRQTLGASVAATGFGIYGGVLNLWTRGKYE